MDYPIENAASGAGRSYRGRFAPTPSGPLHLGSLLTALAGFLQARALDGRWLLRIDDLDAQRSRREHSDTILRQLEAHGLYWDEQPRWQSRHLDEYEAAFDTLKTSASIYRCVCTRAKLSEASISGPDGPVYPGTCRNLATNAGNSGALRLEIGSGTLELRDPWQHEIARDLQRDVGDFVIRRADGLIGYQLACIVDEAAQGITEVVRGADLIGSSMRQIRLQHILKWRSPAYRHLPVLTDAQGVKLSKQNHARPIAVEEASRNVSRCLLMLGQTPPLNLHSAPTKEILRWAISNWDPSVIPRVTRLSAPN